MSGTAPGPPLEAAVQQSADFETSMKRIGAMTPHHQAFCLVMVCMIGHVFESAQSCVTSGAFWAVLACGFCFASCLFSMSLRSTKWKKTLCCVKRRRHVKKVYDRRKRFKFEHGLMMCLLVWHDLCAIAMAHDIPIRDAQFENGLTPNEIGKELDNRCNENANRKNQMEPSESASWCQQTKSPNIMGMQRNLGTQREEAQQAAFERNYILGEDEMMNEIAALGGHDPLAGVCLMTHALKPDHQGTREVRYNLRHGDDFLDIVFFVRQKWADIIHPFHEAALIYVFVQPPPSTTRGIDCLHILVDGEPALGGTRNLVSMAMSFNEGQFSEFWFQAQRNHAEISHQTLVQRMNLEFLCLSEAVVCTCRAGLTVFQQNTNYHNQDGLYLIVEMDLHRDGQEEDHTSLMTRAFNMNRIAAYVYRLGRHGEEELGDSTFYDLKAMPVDLRDRDIWPLIQDFRAQQREGHVIVLLDVEVFQQDLALEARPTDEWREVTYVRKEANRDIFLEDAEVGVFCRGEGTCRVEKNAVLWTENDVSMHEIENGGYFRVSIRSQREDLPFCVQWQQAQQGIQINDMVDTRRYRKRKRRPSEGSSESSDSTALLQVDTSIGRHFHLEEEQRLPPPGNGVDFDAEVTFIEDGLETRAKDRSADNRFVAEFCETRADEPMPGLFLDFIKKVRFGSLDETSDEDEILRSGEQESATKLSLEHLLPIQQDGLSSIESIIETLRNDPEARYTLRQDWDTIVNLHPTVMNVLEAQNFCFSGKVIRMHIFLDGSAYFSKSDGRKRAAWSFVVGLEHDNAQGPNCKLVGFTGAPLEPATLSSYHIGETTCDSGEAECAAMFWAGVWILSWGKECMIETVVHGDNMPTVKASSAEWRSPQTKGGLYEKCRCLWQRIETEKFPVLLKHLHGHRGHPGNEAADSVAKHFAVTNEIFSGRRTKYAKMIAMHSDLERLWWYQDREELPLLGSSRFFERGNVDCLTKVAENDPEEPEQYTNVAMSLVSMNVFSGLDKEASMVSRRKAIAMQASTLGWKIIALQETRYRMSISKYDDLYFMLTASATKAGCFGCEIWLSKSWEIAGRRLRETDFRVFVEEPTMLAVAVNHPGLQADFFSIHAPQRHHVNQDAWWKRLHALVGQRRQKNRTVFILGDMNARVGNDFDPGIGRLHAQDECSNGKCLREMISDFGLALPSTFSDIHCGTSHTFQRHRLDYIAIPHDWMSCVQRSQVAVCFDMLHSKDDHKPLVLDLCFAAPKFMKKKTPTYDKKEACKSSNSHVVQKIFDSFDTLPWESSVDAHCAALSQHIHHGLCSAFPVSKKRREVSQPYISGHLWDLVVERKQMRNEIQMSKRNEIRNFIKKFWCAWRGSPDHSCGSETEMKFGIKYRVFLEVVLEDSNRKINKMIKKDKQQGLQNTLKELEHAFKVRDNKRIYESLKPFQSQNSRKKLKTPKPLPYLMGDNGVVENQKEWHEAWENHWARIECAEVRPWIDHQNDFINQEANFNCNHEDILLAVPSMLQVEQAIRGIKRGKAGGIDGICPDVVRNAGCSAARSIFTLAVKEIVRGQVPLADRGGISMPLFKGKGQQCARTSFRSIVLENCVGKTISRLWRPELEKAFTLLAGSEQGGAKKGMGPTTHILRTRVLQKRAFLSGQSFGMILLDMESAFYKAVRQLLVRNDEFEATDEYCAYFSKALGIGPDEHKRFYEHLRDETMLEKAKTNKAVQKWVLSSMEGSWCKLKTSSNCLATALGTKPGDPTADVLYSLVMTRFLREVNKKCQQKPELNDCVNVMTWVDDVILPFQDSADKVFEKAGKLLEVLHDTATSMGMIPNLKRGKTEVILGFAGVGTQQSKRDFERNEPLLHFNTVRGKKTVEAVNEAVYLGAILEAKGRLMPEIIAGTGRAFSSVKPLRKAVLCNNNVTKPQKKAIIQSLAFSKSAYTIGTWLPMRRAEEKAWKTRTMKIVRLMTQQGQGEFEHVSDEEILVRYGFLSPRELITMATLRMCGMLAQWADESYLEPFVDRLSTQEDTWMTQAVFELNQLGKKVGTGWPHLPDFGAAIQVLKSEHAQKSMNKHIKKYTKLLLHEREQIWFIQQRFPKKNPSLTNFKEDEQEFPCLKCPKVFQTSAARGVHNFKVHGIFCEAYSYAATSTCFACLGQYHSRERLVQHLQWGSMDCLTRLRQMVEPLTKEQIIHLNSMEKEVYKETKRQGKKHVNQTMTFCRGEFDDISELTGDWNDYFSREQMSYEEEAELQSIETWCTEGPLLNLFEELPNDEKLHEILQLVEKVSSRLTSAKVFLIWANLLQQDLRNFHEDPELRKKCMVAWAEMRSRVLSRFM